MSIFTLYLNLALISELQLPILTWRPTSTSKVVVGCYGLDCAPQKGYTEILTPSTSKCNLPWKRGCCRCTWLGRGHPGVQPPPDHCDSHPGQETPLKPQNPRRMSQADRGRDTGGCHQPRTLGPPGRHRGTSSLGDLEESCLFYLVCGTLSRQPQDTDTQPGPGLLPPRKQPSAPVS